MRFANARLRSTGLVAAFSILVNFAAGCSSQVEPSPPVTRTQETQRPTLPAAATGTVAAATNPEALGVVVGTTVELSDVPAFSTVPIRVPVTNRNVHPIRFVFKTADCGCISANSNEGILLDAGQSGELELAFTAGGRPGSVSRHVTYAVSGAGVAGEVKIEIRLTVGPSLIDPPLVDLASCLAGEHKTALFQIRPIPGWKLLGIKQAGGPNVATIQKSEANPNASSASFAVEVSIPRTSADQIGWAFDLDWQTPQDATSIHSRVQVVASVVNGVFEQNTLYLGIVHKSQGLTIDREFPLSNKDFDLRLLLQPSSDQAHGTLSVERTGNSVPSAKVRVVLPPDAEAGMHTCLYEVADGSNQPNRTHDVVQIPVRVLVLP